MFCKLFAVLVVFLIAASPLQAQLYQWVDENGVKHYSNSPPPEDAADVRQFQEVKSQAAAEDAGASESEQPAESEGGGEASAETAAEPGPESPGSTEPAAEGQQEDVAVTEGGDDEDETGDAGEIENSDETAAPDTGDISDIEEESPESPDTGRTGADELIEQERDRLEITMAQLNRQLEEAQTARDRGSSYDVEQWNQRIAQIRSQIEEERSQSEARIEQIRLNAGSQP